MQKQSENKMKVNTAPGDLQFQSPFVALGLHRHRAQITYLGLESGGRSRRHLDNNLLMPGPGGGIPDTESVREIVESADGILYRGVRTGSGEEYDLSCRTSDARSFTLEVVPQAGNIRPAGLELVLDPVTGSPSIWSATAELPDYPAQPGRKQEMLPPLVNHYGLPLLIHFPDYGFLRVETSGAVSCSETWEASRDRQGLALGLNNRGHHTVQQAYHHGRIRLLFSAPDNSVPLKLSFTCEPEHYPALPADSGPQWDGLRRCWHNAFTRDRRYLTMGDNPLLSGVSHLALHFKSEMGLFTPEILPGVTVHDTFRRALDLSFATAQGPSGELNWCFSEGANRDSYEVEGFVDTTASTLTALHHHICATGDWSLFKKHKAGVERAVEFLLGLEKEGNGMLQLPYHGRFFDGADHRRTRNWWDNVAFGHWDACFMLLCHHALIRMEDLFEAAGSEAITAKIAAWRQRFKDSFHEVFWQPGTGCYAGWVDDSGRAHDYAFTFITAMAVNEEIVPVETGRPVLQNLLDRMQALGYDGTYGVPGNLIPFEPADTIDWDVLGRWGVYENGGLCGMAAGHFLQALYKVGMRAEADRIFFAMLETFEREPTHSGPFPGYGKSIDWRTREGVGCGYNYLADNYYFLIAGVVGHLGQKLPRLSGGG